MALAGDTLKEFIVGLTWGLDQGAHTTLMKMLAQVESAGKKVSDEDQKHTQQLKQNWVVRSQEVDSASRKIAHSIDQYVVASFRRMAVAATAAFAAVAGTQAIKAAIDSLDDLNTKAREANTSMEALANLGAAGKLLGAGNSIAASAGAISQAIKEQRGVLQQLEVIGVTETKDADKRAIQISQALRRIVAEHQGNEDVARLIATRIGLSQQQTTEYLRDNFAIAVERARELRAAWGGAAEKADAAVQAYKTQTQELSVHIDEFRNKLAGAAATAFTPFLTALNDALLKNAPQIAGGLDQISAAIGKWSAEKGKEFGDWIDDTKRGAIDLKNAVLEIADAIKKVSELLPTVNLPGKTHADIREKSEGTLESAFGFMDPNFSGAGKFLDSLFGTKHQMGPPIPKDLKDHTPPTPAPAPAPAPEPPKPWLLPSQSSYGGEGQTPARRSGGLGRFGIADFGRPDPTERQASISADEIEAAKKQDGAAIKQEKAAETFAKAVEDDRKARQEGGGGGGGGIAGMARRGLDWLKGLLPGGGGDGMPGGWIDKGGFEGNAAGGGGGAASGGGGGGGAAGGGGKPASGPLRARQAEAMRVAMDQLRKEGVPDANLKQAAAHLVGQATVESGINPQATHDPDPSGKPTGYGIYGARLPRRDAMLAWLKANNYAQDSLEGQMRYMAHEAMSGKYPKTKQILMSGDAGGADTVRTLMNEFEGPRDRNQDRSGAVRQALESLNAPSGGDVTSTRGSRADQTVIKTGSGARVTVGSQYAENFKGFLKDYEAAGGKIDPGHTFGYANRNIAGTNTKSYHGVDGGRAIDINMSGRNVISSGLPGGIAQEEELARKWGLRPGSSFRNPDRGHFEVHDAEAARQALIRNASRLGSSGTEGGVGAGTPLSSGPVANDNSRTISQVNNFNTKVHASDPKAAASVFKRSNEQLSGMATAQLKSNMR
jgi:hypothetical protein